MAPMPRLLKLWMKDTEYFKAATAAITYIAQREGQDAIIPE